MSMQTKTNIPFCNPKKIVANDIFDNINIHLNPLIL